MKSFSYLHRYEAAQRPDAPTLLLLHGTGGNENDLIALGRQLAPDWNLLSPRGDVSEGGHARFFRRFAEGVFDLEDVTRRTHTLADFVASAAKSYGFDPSRVTALGYSNGANIAASLLLLRPESLAQAALLRPMVVLQPEKVPDLSGKRVVLLSGQYDPIVPETHPDELADLLRRGAAEAEVHWLPTGHQLSQADFQLTHDFLHHAAAAG